MFLQAFSRGCFASNKIKRTDNRGELYHLIFLSKDKKFSVFFEKESLSPALGVGSWRKIFDLISRGGCNFLALSDDYWFMTYGKKEQIICAKDAGRSTDVHGFNGYLFDVQEKRICSCLIPEKVRDVVIQEYRSGKFVDILNELEINSERFNPGDAKALLDEFIDNEDRDSSGLMSAIRENLLISKSPYAICAFSIDRSSWIRLSVSEKSEIYHVARPATSLWHTNVRVLDREISKIKEVIGLNVDGAAVAHLKRMNQIAFTTATATSQEVQSKVTTSDTKKEGHDGLCRVVAKLILGCKIS